MAADLDKIISIWQPAYGQVALTREDARAIAENVTGFFAVLKRWADQDALLQQEEHEP